MKRRTFRRGIPKGHDDAVGRSAKSVFHLKLPWNHLSDLSVDPEKDFFMSFQISWNPLTEGGLEHMELRVSTCGDCPVGLLGEV